MNIEKREAGPPLFEAPALPDLSCDDLTLFRIITRRDGYPPDDVEISDGDGTVDAVKTERARKTLTAYREAFYAALPPEELPELAEDLAPEQEG